MMNYLHKLKRENTYSKLLKDVKRWRVIISPIFGIIIIGIFIRWIWIYRDNVVSTFEKVGFFHLTILFIVMWIPVFLSVYTFIILVRDMGYSFGFADGYHSLNLSQLASMVPGKIWGFTGLVGLLWSKGISTGDSVLIVLINTLLLLSACAIVGISGLISIIGWGYTIIFLLPFFFLFFGRNWLDKIRHKFYPESTHLPSSSSLLKVLFLGIIVWILTAACFTWLLYLSEGMRIVPFWVGTGAYAAGYLGGFLSLIAPSGLGVSEGLVTLILHPYLGIEKILAVAISYRLINTLIIWINILITIVLTSIKPRKISNN